jgi:adenylosuccinate lyase
MTDYSTYQSPFSWRYGSQEMRKIWSEEGKRRLWRKIWVCLAETQMQFGLVTPEQVADLSQHAQEVNVARSLEIEAEIHHDLMAELRAFNEQCLIGGAILHLGATSMDIEDNADVLRQRESLLLLKGRLKNLLLAFVEKVEAEADTPIMAFTHIQPAEPTTLGYRLAMYAQDLFENWQGIQRLLGDLRGKGFKGAVGSGAAYAELLGIERLDEFEQRMSEKLALPFYQVATQTYPRQQDYTLVSTLAGIGASLYKFAFDLRVMQSPPLGELGEPFGSRQVGSSAMPFKRNPINSEKIDSLARSMAEMPAVAWHNAAHNLLERTLDDSANRRSLIPEAFLTCDELILTSTRIVHGLRINRDAIQRNLAIYAPFAATERVMMAAAKAGADRQVCHERLRELALAAWREAQAGLSNPLEGWIRADPFFSQRMTPVDFDHAFEVSGYVGFAPSRARELAARIRYKISNEVI